MTLYLKDERNDKDWDRYQGVGPFEVRAHYICDRCDKTRCHIIVERAEYEESTDGFDIEKAVFKPETIRFHCPYDEPMEFRLCEDVGEEWKDARD